MYLQLALSTLILKKRLLLCNGKVNINFQKEIVVSINDSYRYARIQAKE